MQNGNNISFSAGDVGIGTTTPGGMLEVGGTIISSATDITGVSSDYVLEATHQHHTLKQIGFIPPPATSPTAAAVLDSIKAGTNGQILILTAETGYLWHFTCNAWQSFMQSQAPGVEVQQLQQGNIVTTTGILQTSIVPSDPNTGTGGTTAFTIRTPGDCATTFSADRDLSFWASGETLQYSQITGLSSQQYYNCIDIMNNSLYYDVSANRIILSDQWNNPNPGVLLGKILNSEQHSVLQLIYSGSGSTGRWLEMSSGNCTVGTLSTQC